MSGLVVGLTLSHLPTDSHSLLAVALVLADQADARGESVFPSIPLVATLARLSDRQVQYCMRDLNEMGFLVLVRKGGGRGNPTRWRIDLDWLKAQPDLVSLWRNGAQPAPFDKTMQKRCTDVSGKGQKGCINSAPACAPDPITLPNPIYPTTLVGRVVDFSLDELLEATDAAEKAAGKEMGWKLVAIVKERFETNACNVRDVAAVENLRRSKAGAEEKQRRLSASAPMDPAAVERGRLWLEQRKPTPNQPEGRT